MPRCFQEEYPNTQIIIACTEIYTQTPSSLVTNSQLYSNYENYTTFKALVGIAPHGAITFISLLFLGNMSDVEITRVSGLLSLHNSGNLVMADKWFVIRKYLENIHCSLNIPPFLCENRQFDASEIAEMETIARLRIYVERIMRKVKVVYLVQTFHSHLLVL